MPFTRLFTHSLTLLGEVRSIDPSAFQFTLCLDSGDEIDVYVGTETQFTVLMNLDGIDRDRFPDPQLLSPSEDPRSTKLRKYLSKGRLIATQGIYQEDRGKTRYDARMVYLLQSESGDFYFENTHWWITQISRLADQWLDQLFGTRRDYTFSDFVALYRTNLNIAGLPTDDTTQETATLSRLIYGLSSAYLLTGNERYRLAAKAGVAFQRESFRHLSHDGRYCFWASGRKSERYITKIFETSLNADDEGSIPLYEQIYALSGLTLYYRIALDWEVLEDIRRTVAMFNDFYLDGPPNHRSLVLSGSTEERLRSGYFSHLDYVTMLPDADILGKNKARKNWNSNGDHLPAYLINLVLGLDPLPTTAPAGFVNFLSTLKEMMDLSTELIRTHFPGHRSPYVNERCWADWTPDHEWGWQQNRAIVGHNLKIAWNLTRMSNYYRQIGESEKASELCIFAENLAKRLAEIGLDAVRGGCFDAVEREPRNGMPIEFVWGNTKDFWQQEQGILAYIILYGVTHNDWYLNLARRMMAFWNLFFLDQDYNGIFFRVTDDGVPMIRGNYGNKGGHSISGYHAFELNFLAHLYLRAYVAEPGEEAHQPNFVLYFRPDRNSPQRWLNVLPDYFPPGCLHLKSVTVDGAPREIESPDVFQIPLGEDDMGALIVVEFERQPNPGGVQ